MKRLLFLGLMLVLSGCQTAHLFDKEVVVDNATFMSLWTVYDHCRSSQDLDAMTADAHRLVIAVRNTPSVKDLAPVPKPIERFVADPVKRLAVDLEAMTAACQLHTGQFALSKGRTDLAADMFQTIITEHGEPDYRYYVTQALAGLVQVQGQSQFVLEREEATPARHLFAERPLASDRAVYH